MRSGRAALTESEQDDLEAEAELEEEEEEEGAGLSYEEYLASRKPVALPKLPEVRKAGEGVAISVNQRDESHDLEVRFQKPIKPSSLP